MIAACPTCSARYRIDASKLRPEGARLRCSRCETVFRVRAPVEPGPQPVAPVAPVESPAPAPSPGRDRARLVLVAHSEPDGGKATANALNSWGLDSMLVHDGVEAILNIQRSLPAVVILDAALPKMFGFQVCELMKRNSQLQQIKVVLVGAIHDQDRYRRPPPEELYGADAYVERQDLPDCLRPVLERWGLSIAPVRPEPIAPRAPEPVRAVAPRPEPSLELGSVPASATAAPAPVAAATAPVAAASEAEVPPEIAQAERLARIIVSDIVLYNQEKFDAAVRSGNVVEALSAELQEGHALFAQRVDPRVGTPQDFLNRELVRLARTRGMT